MKADIRKRLELIESKCTDWISKLELIDYLPLEDYDTSDEWKEVHHDQTVTVYRNRQSGEIRGVYCDRRSDGEKLKEGGRLEYV